MLVSELPKAEPDAAAHDGVALAAGRASCPRCSAAGVVVAFSPLLPANLEQALGNPIGAVTFVLGTAGFAWALVVDDACLGVKRSGLQVWRNLVASEPPVPAHRRPAAPRVHRRARAPGVLGAAAARLDPLHALAAPAAAARPHQPAAAGRRARLPGLAPAQPRAEPGPGGRVADGPGRRGADAGLGGERRVRDRLADGDVRLPAAVPPRHRAVRARCERLGGGVPPEHGAHDSRGALAQRAALRGRLGARRAGAADLRRRLLASLLGDPGVVGASRALDGAQGPPRHPVAVAAAVRARDPSGRCRADHGDRRGHDGWDHRRSPWSLHRVADRDGSGDDAGPSVAAPRLRWPALAAAAVRRRRTQLGRAALQVVVGAALVLAIGGVGVWTATRGESGRHRHVRPTGCPSLERRCRPASRARPTAARRSTSTCSPPPATRRTRSGPTPTSASWWAWPRPPAPR